MSEFDLVVVKAVKPNKNPKNTYRVQVKFMHGDADGETVKMKDFPIDVVREEYEPSIDEILTYLKAFFSLDCNARYAFCMGKRGVKEKVLYEAGLDDDAIDRCEEDFLWEGDVTADHQFQASPVEAKITYFDANGVEFEVSAFLKGTKEKVKLTR